MALLATSILVTFACTAIRHDTTNGTSPSPTTPLAESGDPFHSGEVGIVYASVSESATGGVGPYHWTVSAGELPPGLTVGADGTVWGTPTAPGDYSFTIQVTDAGGGKVTVDGKIPIAASLSASLNPSCAQYCNVELGCVTVCGAFGQQTGGVAPFSYAVTQGILPAGTSLSGLALTGTFTGLPGWLQFTVEVTDSLGASASLSPKFWMYPHIAWSTGTKRCIGDHVTACLVRFTYSGGIPGDQPTVAITGVVGPICIDRGPLYPELCPPAPTNTPNGLNASASVVGPDGGGTVTVVVAADCGIGSAGCPAGYAGAVGLVLVDQALCAAPAVGCRSEVATVEVEINGG